MKMAWLIFVLFAPCARAATLPASSGQVKLTCSAPANSTDAIAGYNFYRANAAGGTFALLNTLPAAGCSYADQTAPANATVNYFVESVDANGVTSAPSNTTSATMLAAIAAGTLTGKTT